MGNQPGHLQPNSATQTKTRSSSSLSAPPTGAANPAGSPPPVVHTYREINWSELVSEDTPLGAGGSGAVYKGVWNYLPVAIKLLHMPDQVEFQKELTVLEKLGQHSAIVSLLGACTTGQNQAIITEFIAGGSLGSYLESDKPLTWELIILMCVDICRGMLHIHGAGLIHRDLKPTNLLIASLSTEWGSTRLKVCDFGFARDYSRGMTKGVGTPLFMAPEILTAHYNSKVDVYAFSMVLFQMITRVEPLADVHIFKIHEEVQKGTRPAIPEHTPPILANLMREAWAPSPNDRPTFKQILETLTQAYNERETFGPLEACVLRKDERTTV